MGIYLPNMLCHGISRDGDLSICWSKLFGIFRKRRCQLGKFHHDLTSFSRSLEIMVNKGNHPKMAEHGRTIQVSELLYNLLRYYCPFDCLKLCGLILHDCFSQTPGTIYHACIDGLFSETVVMSPTLSKHKQH